MKELSIKDVPMLTDDQVEIHLNDVLYTADWSTGYDFKKEGKVKIEAHRVISVNNSARHFRTRCMNGCETSHEYSKGCSRQRLYGTIEAAKAYAEGCMVEDQKKCDEKIKKARERIHRRPKENSRVFEAAACSESCEGGRTMKTFGEMPDAKQDEVAEMLTDAFYESEPIAQLVHDYLVKNQPNPMSVVFAGLLIDKMMEQSLGKDKWPELRKFAIESWKKMDEGGILGELKRL